MSARKVGAALAVLLAAGAFAALAWRALGGRGREGQLAELRSHVIKIHGYFRPYAAKPFAGRVFAAPPEIVDYLAKDNAYNGYDAAPASATLTPELAAQVTAVLAALPRPLQKALEEKMLGVFTVTGLGSSAYTDFVRDEDGVPSGAFVVLDTAALSRTANEWLSWKESSPFLADPAVRIEGTLEDAAHDTPAGALEFLLIHELGHVLAFDSDVHPLWTADPETVNLRHFPYAAASWTVTDGEYAARTGGPAPGPIVYYKASDERPPARAAKAYYDWLKGTDFPTLYAATSPFDDFADSLAVYVHAEVFGKPFELRILEDGKVVRTLTSCFSEPRCAGKRRALEAVIEASGRY